MAGNIDMIADVLKQLKVKGKAIVTPTEAEEAARQYNEIVKELKNCRQFNRADRVYSEEMNRTQPGPHSQESGSSRAMENLRDQNRKLMEEAQTLKKQREELQIRLSTLAGQKLTDGNPDIADLSDPFRPTNLAEQFRQVYDDEWTLAYEIMEHTVDEPKIIDFLTNLIKEIDRYCSSFSKKQISRMQMYVIDDLASPKVELEGGKGTAVAKNRSTMDKRQQELANKLLKDFRKSFAALSVRPLIEIFDGNYLAKLKEPRKIARTSTEINNFVAKSIELIWMMKIQHPPMEFEWKYEGEKHDRTKYTFYTKTGVNVKYTVWPAVVLHSEGPLVSKGVVETL